MTARKNYEPTVTARVTNFKGLHLDSTDVDAGYFVTPEVSMEDEGRMRLRLAPIAPRLAVNGLGRFAQWFYNLERSTAATVELQSMPTVVREAGEEESAPLWGEPKLRTLAVIIGQAVFDEFPGEAAEIVVPRMSLHSDVLRELPTGEMVNLAYIVPGYYLPEHS
jgi:hypothetical protein